MIIEQQRQRLMRALQECMDKCQVHTSNSDEWTRLLLMAQAIEDDMAGRVHGDFVHGMSTKDFELAFLHADAGNKKFFSVLMAFRLTYARAAPEKLRGRSVSD